MRDGAGMLDHRGGPPCRPNLVHIARGFSSATTACKAAKSVLCWVIPWKPLPTFAQLLRLHTTHRKMTPTKARLLQELGRVEPIASTLSNLSGQPESFKKTCNKRTPVVRGV